MEFYRKLVILFGLYAKTSDDVFVKCVIFYIYVLKTSQRNTQERKVYEFRYAVVAI